MIEIKDFKELVVNNKTYKLGLKTRRDAMRLEENGFSLQKLDQTISSVHKLIYAGLTTYDPTITEEECFEIEDSAQNSKINLMELANFVAEQYSGFITPLFSQVKTAKA